MRHRGMDLSAKKAVLTGASSGIGRELALALAQRGATLALAARRADLLDDLADEICAAGAPRPAVLPVDLAVAGSAAELGRRALDALGGVDIAINNAGTNLTGAQSLLADGAAARAVFEVNVWSPLALTSTLLPAMRAADSGVIVNVTSTVQAVPLPLLGYYAASKAALAQATRSLRLELAGTGIRVLEVVPGSTDTALRDIDELPWKAAPPPTFPPVAPASTAAAIVRALERGARRVVHPRYSLLPLEIPALGRLVAELGGRRVDTRSALAGPGR
ncbi:MULTISPECIES: SDR family oxidoreductase [unclassified Mycolicibacterium]|uniref:SDR family NAD(P)-dependent oxidoreductase n=1 Tax=unclassified Mycolicibacterium TaxID=2636767 RepID=UPI0012DD4168|nr:MULTISPECIES: SDR family NAD(P)-dependent oxidoreductase [unclassified Mycolicibacterium]MUL83740.1 SDR family NAD(P)-dependent oxidoreductase [Mycolicibacterium sp. CBMA 329]MUL90731.1 SDR family NAD(P)-dependent oxidoreductase [Mycolicibacterium sp. CBMA 331]MUM00699.1 SDR family NAD(P)-dependent oxidoreductase [Mycolicibacterium sp. CBMA 334]MUM29770.1 SDR family NAD(P)-dependent oxidoreductase [Mycolicibacterium sp. CBMA 295]MUM41675.1 SDR family NAD(P)-dependent oxidoreductase [Mycolic